MKVRLLATFTGTRDGEPWPARGAEMVVPDAEGAELCANGFATPVADPEPVEKRATTARKPSK